MKTQTAIRRRAVYFAAFAAALLAACSDFFELQAEPGIARGGESFPITLRGDVIGPNMDSRDGYALGTRNYVQLIVLDKEGNLEAWSECRDNGSGKGSLQIPELDGDTEWMEYTFLLLTGHWQRDYGNDTPRGEFAYFEDRPPTLLAAGYTMRKPKNTDNGDITVTMYPLAVTASFVSPDAESVKVDKMLPKPAALPAGNWSARWTMARMSLCQLLYAQGLAEAEADIGKIFPGRDKDGKDARKGLVWMSGNAAEPDDTELVFSNLGEIAVDLASYMPTGAEARYVNFNMMYKPYGTPREVRPLSDNPTGRNAFDPWIIRNGVNDKPQDTRTNFTTEANWRRGRYNGNGAAAFTSVLGEALIAPTLLSVKRGYTAGEGDYIDVAWTAPGDNPAKSYKLYLFAAAGPPAVVKKEFSAEKRKARIFNSDYNPALDYNVQVIAIAVNGEDPELSGIFPSPSVLAYTVKDQASFHDVMANSKVREIDLTLEIQSITGPVTLNKVVTIAGKDPDAPVSITGGLTITSGANVKLANAVVNGGGSNVVTVSGGKLVIQTGAVITGGGDGVVVNSGGAVTMTGGKVCADEDPDAFDFTKKRKGVVVNSGGTFNMNGGSVWNNEKEGVRVKSGGTFHMTGGDIYHNGLGVWVETGAAFTKTSGIVYGAYDDIKDEIGEAEAEMYCNWDGSVYNPDRSRYETLGPHNNYPVQ